MYESTASSSVKWWNLALLIYLERIVAQWSHCLAR
jgi:hypothetical protein